jgi:hypothetical protein
MDNDSQLAQCMLKQLINDICNHLDDKQALCNNKFLHGFLAGYQEAYRQWGVEIEERMDETFKLGEANDCLEEKEGWALNHSEGLCASPEVLMPQT